MVRSKMHRSEMAASRIAGAALAGATVAMAVVMAGVTGAAAANTAAQSTEMPKTAERKVAAMAPPGVATQEMSIPVTGTLTGPDGGAAIDLRAGPRIQPAQVSASGFLGRGRPSRRRGGEGWNGGPGTPHALSGGGAPLPLDQGGEGLV